MTEAETLPATRNGTPGAQPAPASDPPPSTLNLLALGVDRGFSPEQLEKLLALHERVEKGRAVEAFNRDMRDCQAAMPVAVRDAKNSQTSSRYARLESLNEICKPVYTAHGFALSFAEADAPLPGWKRIVCDVRHVGGHEVRYHVDLPLDGVGAKGNAIGQMNPVQAAISTGTYGQRTLTARIFNITIADTDKDGQRDFECVNDEELARLRSIIQDNNLDLKRFLNWAKAESLESVSRQAYRKTIGHYRQGGGS